MPLELWIVIALIVIAGIGLGILRVRRKQRAEAPQDGKNVYPLF